MFHPGFEGRRRNSLRGPLNAILQFQILERKNVQWVGSEGLQVDVEGKDPIKVREVRARVIFGNERSDN